MAPFADPELEWDFRLERVQSINASGHKYGLVYPGVGWAVWRNREALPQELVFDVNYLGGHMPTFALNFSRPGSQVIAQYYMFLSLGMAGYRSVQQASSSVAQHIASEVAGMGPYELLTDGSELPVLAFTPEAKVRSQLSLSWGVETFLTNPVEHTDEMVRQVDEALLEIGRVALGDLVVIIAGSPPGIPGSTNALRIHRMGDAINEAAPAYRRA